MKELHSWQVSIAQAREMQRELAGRVSRRNEVGEVRLVAGADISAPDREGVARGAVVVLAWPELALVEARTVEQAVTFPYVPGLLSFRESPLVLAAWEKLSCQPDLLLVDGQGLAHPRRFGLACHLGLWLDIPAIGCAKSVLVGRHEGPGPEPGDWAPLCDGEETIGAALRTRARGAPLYASIGHRVDLETARGWVLALCRGNRLPEPSRLAHLAASGRLKQEAGQLSRRCL